MGNIVSGQAVITKTSNAILVLPEDHLIIQRKNQKRKLIWHGRRPAAVSVKCVRISVRDMLWVIPLTPVSLCGRATCKDVQDPNIFINTYFCSSCGLCEMYSCMQGLSPRSLMAEYKLGLRAAGVPVPKGIIPEPVKPSREMRKVPMERLMSRLGLTKYNVDAPLEDETFP